MSLAEDDVSREDFRYWLLVPTRWSDNDMFGHLNNVAYFRFFEAIVVNFLLDEAEFDWTDAPVIPYAAEILCRFRRPLSFPVVVEAGLAIARLGTSSVTYRLGLFAPGATAAAAVGHFVHVFVDRISQRPINVPEAVRTTCERSLLVASPRGQ